MSSSIPERHAVPAASPAVSVVVPAYRVSEYLGEALDSVFRQTYTDFEVFVIDQDRDESMDRALARFEGRIMRLSLSPPSLGAARNLAIRQARGGIVAQLDGDDAWEPDALERLVGMLDADPSLDLVFPNAVFFGDPALDGVLVQALYPAYRPVVFEDVATRRSQVFGAAVYRREAAVRVGCFDESLTFGEDLDLWLRMLRAGSRFDFTERPLYRYRQRPGALSSRFEMPHLKALIRIYDKLLADPNLTSSQRGSLEKGKMGATAYYWLENAKRRLAEGDRHAAREAFDSFNCLPLRTKLRVVVAALRSATVFVRRHIRFH